MNNRTWKKIQLKVWLRDNYACKRCGKKNKLTIHHLDNSGGEKHHSYSNNNIKNLITFCMSCHGKTHWENAKKEGFTNIYEWIGNKP